MKGSQLEGSRQEGLEELAQGRGVSCGRVLVVGSGPVGMRFVCDLLERRPDADIHLFGNEPYLPYNRVQLSAVLGGDVARDAIDLPLPSTEEHPNFRYSIATICEIQREEKRVVDNLGQSHAYDTLVLAIGARAHVPSVPGVEQTGVYTFRNLHDTESLYTRVLKSRHIVVVGGGLLGIEAAKALLRCNTRITLVQQGARLMNRQLDDEAAALLQARVESLGIEVLTHTGVRQIVGDRRVSGIVTNRGEEIGCDTVLLCAGIKPNTQLARVCGLRVATGIVVDDRLATSDPSIFAVGECCEHRGLTYGLVNPGFEQAAVAAENLAGGHSVYVGSQVASRLKVLDEKVFSIGEVCDLAERPRQSEHVYQDEAQGVYRKIVVNKGRLIGAVGIGEWPELNRVHEAFSQQRPVRFWQRRLYATRGRLWSGGDTEDVTRWPATAVVCQCNGVTQGQLCDLIEAGSSTLAEVQTCSGAGTVCGSCKPLVQQLVADKSGQAEPLSDSGREFGWLALLLASAGAIALALLLILIPEAEIAGSVQEKSWFEGIWSDKFWKQVSGFSLLGLTAMGLLMSLRKRLNIKWLGQFSAWRVVHAVLGLVCAGVLMLHTGFHLGSNLNQWLMMNFLAVLAVGAATGVVFALSHRLQPLRAVKVRKTWNWVHIVIAWPLPALLAAHVLSVYYF